MLNPDEIQAIDKAMNDYEDTLVQFREYGRMCRFLQRYSIILMAGKTIFTFKLRFAWKREVLRQLWGIWKCV